ncbi:MAG TPA: M1 family aminopeptidase [Usitatibacter sp.]|nr:M1 family aminopeptidase [Usitatibacter sp.]
MKMIAAAALLALSLPVFAQDPKPPELRLGDVAVPRAYAVRLAIDPRESAFEGEVRIELRVNRATPVLWLNAEKLMIERAEFTFGDRRVPARVITTRADFVGFEVEGGFPAGDAVAEIAYRGATEEVATRGLFRQKEGEEWYAVSQFEAMNARRAIPCFDEPGWKTPWQLTIDAPTANQALANSPETATADVPGRSGWKRHVFAVTRPLPSYLVALAVGPFELVDGGKAGIMPTPMRYAVPKGRAADARFARESSPRLLALLEDYFGGAYPFEKLDAVTIPATFGFGAMENVGLISYSSEILLSPPARESLGFQRRYASVGAHEIAHMWFGNLVTLAWWNDIWLNEAFATWASRKTLRAYRPDWAGGWREGESRRRAVKADRLMSARRIANPVATHGDVSAAFDNITYSKGSEVLKMFETWIGPERFRAGVQGFLRAHAYGNATSLDFFKEIGAASGRGDTAVAAFRSFVDQPGLPLVDVSVKCAKGGVTLEVSQQRFKPLGTRGADAQWTTPACFRYESGGQVRKQCAEITGRQVIELKEARSCPAWVVGNADGAGHWVARYPRAAMKALLPQVPKLPEAEAVALSADTALLVEAGLIARDDALMLAEGFLRHPSLGVREGGVELLEAQRPEWLDAAQRMRVRTMAKRWMLPLAREVGWQARAGESIGIQDLRTALLPYAAEMDEGQGLRAQARELAFRWLDDRSAIAASTVPAVLESAARFADDATLARLERSMAEARDRSDRNEIIKALSKVRSPLLRDRVLALTLAEGSSKPVLDGREAYALLEDALKDDHNRSATFAYLRANWQRLVAKMPAESVPRLIRRLPNLCTPADREAFTTFFKPRLAEHAGAQTAYDQALEAIEICVAVNARG